MKKINIILTIAVVVLLVGVLGGCDGFRIVSGSNHEDTREYALSDFNRVNVSSGFTVNIRRADTYKVEVTTSDNLFEYVDITVNGDTLYIRLRQFITYRRAKFEANITLPTLRALSVSGASKGSVTGIQTSERVSFVVSGASTITLTGIKAGDADIEVSGASRLSGSLEMEDGDIEVSGASNVTLTGTASDVRLEASGASSLRLEDFPVRNADVVLSGASNGNVTVGGRLDIEATGASRLTYGGNPTLGKVEVSGASTLSRR